MKVKKVPLCYLLFAVIMSTWGQIPVSPCALASGLDGQMVQGLKDLKKVSVSVESKGDAIKQFGFDTGRLRRDIVAFLAKKGLPVDATEAQSSQGGNLHLQAVMMVIRSGQGAPVGITYAVDGYLTDEIAIKGRAKSKSLLGITWKASGHHGYVNMNNLSKVSKEIFNVVEEFTRDWQSANSAKKAGLPAPVSLAPVGVSTDGQSSTPLSGSVTASSAIDLQQKNRLARQRAEAQQAARRRARLAAEKAKNKPTSQEIYHSDNFRYGNQNYSLVF